MFINGDQGCARRRNTSDSTGEVEQITLLADLEAHARMPFACVVLRCSGFRKRNNFWHGCALYLCTPPFVDSVDGFRGLTVEPNQRHRCQPMELETKFFRLSGPVAVGEQIEGWQVCWLGGWDKARLFFFVMAFRRRGVQR